MRTLLIILILICTCSCSQRDRVSYALSNAGRNRSELEKVINYYADSNDTLKIQAAYFIIENMTEHGSLWSKSIEEFNKQISSHAERVDMKYINNLWDSLSVNNKTIYIKDIENITSSYIINNIEHAFRAWRKSPWKEEIDFKLFLNYVLPYRFENELLVDGVRDSLYNRYFPLVSKAKSMKEAYEILHDTIWKFMPSSSSKFPYLLDPLSMFNQQKSTCLQRCLLLGSIMRSVGLPAAIDDVGFWANYSNSSHTWTSLVTNHGTYTIYRDDKESKINNIIDASLFEVDYDIPKDYELATYFKKRHSKIWRTTFKYNDSIIGNSSNKGLDLNKRFKIDVSREYGLTNDINIKLSRHIDNLYLCTYVTAQNWQPLCVSKVTSNQVQFNSLGDSIVYIPAIVTGKNITAIGNPFIISKDKIKCLEPSKAEKQTIRITRKYPLTGKWMNEWIPMIGGKFEVSNDSNFIKYKELYNITKVPVFLNDIDINDTGTYRYLRYISDSSCDTPMAEIEVYNEHGIIKSSVSYSTVSNVYKCIDGDTFTRPDIANGYILGFDLGKKERITKLRFFPWNDGNFVIPNHKYELFYFDKTWISLGSTTAIDYYLTYENVPKNALLLLRDLSDGYEERPFTYENEKQVWW